MDKCVFLINKLTILANIRVQRKNTYKTIYKQSAKKIIALAKEVEFTSLEKVASRETQKLNYMDTCVF